MFMQMLLWGVAALGTGLIALVAWWRMSEPSSRELPWDHADIRDALDAELRDRYRRLIR